MSAIDMLRGVLTIVLIAVVAGAIAYVGDRVGHQVGRKRLTIFNIRPRYTSTIIAVGTGMFIAIVLMIVAIFASNEVKTAFFTLNQINGEIARAQAQERELENKVNNEHVEVPLDALMGAAVGVVPVNASASVRRDRVNAFYVRTVAYVNRVYTKPPFDLKRYQVPPDVAHTIDRLAENPKMVAAVAQSPVLLFATADRNLYPHDRIHFAIGGVQDRLIIPRGNLIGYEVVPSGSNAALAIAELQKGFVPQRVVQLGMPVYFAGNVDLLRTYPDLAQMQHMLQTHGTYILTAYAAQDIYPHTFGVPIVATLQKAP